MIYTTDTHIFALVLKKDRRVAKPRGMCMHSREFEPVCRRPCTHAAAADEIIPIINGPSASTAIAAAEPPTRRWRRARGLVELATSIQRRRRQGEALTVARAAAAAGTGKGSLDRLSRGRDLLSTRQCWAASNFSPVIGCFEF